MVSAEATSVARFCSSYRTRRQICYAALALHKTEQTDGIPGSRARHTSAPGRYQRAVPGRRPETTRLRTWDYARSDIARRLPGARAARLAPECPGPPR